MVGRLRLGAPIARVAIAIWLGAMLLLGAALLAKHVVALPAPEKNTRLASSLSALRVSKATDTWLAVHVLYSECRCSQRVVAHLLSTNRPNGWEEVVLWVGNGVPDPKLNEHYRVRRVSNAELAKFGIDAAPLLVVLDPKDELRYVGGYSTRKQGPELEDLRIFAAAQRHDVLAELPVFGCAVSDRLRRELSILPGI
jgi:hypothetical protein